MKTATVREMQHHLCTLLERVGRGEHITITRRGRIVARLVPARLKATKLMWPDFAARMKRLFPAGPPPGAPPSDVIRRTREERL